MVFAVMLLLVAVTAVLIVREMRRQDMTADELIDADEFTLADRCDETSVLGIEHKDTVIFSRCANQCVVEHLHTAQFDRWQSMV